VTAVHRWRRFHTQQFGSESDEQHSLVSQDLQKRDGERTAMEGYSRNADHGYR